MAEAEWLASNVLRSMLTFLRDKASDRKLRLLGTAYCRRYWLQVSRWFELSSAVASAEQYADGIITAARLVQIWETLSGYSYLLGHRTLNDPRVAAYRLAIRTVSPDPWDAPLELMQNLAWDADRDVQSSFVRCLFGIMSFHTVTVNPVWLAWNDGTIPQIAEAIHEERAMERLPILADALEDAGCDNA